MQDWSMYYFTDIPFVDGGHIQVESNDGKLNGRIFSKAGMEKPFRTLLDLINLRKHIAYVTSQDEVRGTGKSALTAAVYWHIVDTAEMNREILPVWVSVHDYRTINQLMGRVLETLVYAGVIQSIQKKLREVSGASVDKLLAERKRQRLPSEVSALTQILLQRNETLAWKYMNIRRSFPTVGHLELFTDLLMMFGSADARRVIVFIDQFEEYVRYQRGQKLVQLGEDIKDLHRSMAESGNLSFVVTMHPVDQVKFERYAQEIINSYGEISANSTTVTPLMPRHLAELARAYIRYYRTKSFPKSLYETYPIKQNLLEYVSEHAENRPRTMINILSNLLNEAIEVKAKEITTQFAKSPQVRARVGLGSLAEK